MAERFRRLAEGFYVAGQLRPEDIADAAAMGIALIINNRPDGEEPFQPSAADIANAAGEAGLAYAAVPISGPPGVADVDAFEAALTGAKGPVLAFCRSGMRSTVLRALALARAGADAGDLIEEAAEAGYDLSGLAPHLMALSRKNR